MVPLRNAITSQRGFNRSAERYCAVLWTRGVSGQRGHGAGRCRSGASRPVSISPSFRNNNLNSREGESVICRMENVMLGGYLGMRERQRWRRMKEREGLVWRKRKTTQFSPGWKLSSSHLGKGGRVTESVRVEYGALKEGCAAGSSWAPATWFCRHASGLQDSSLGCGCTFSTSPYFQDHSLLSPCWSAPETRNEAPALTFLLWWNWILWACSAGGFGQATPLHCAVTGTAYKIWCLNCPCNMY